MGPNPAFSLTVLDIQGDYTGEIKLSCLDISGKILRNVTIYKIKPYYPG